MLRSKDVLRRMRWTSGVRARWKNVDSFMSWAASDLGFFYFLYRLIFHLFLCEYGYLSGVFRTQIRWLFWSHEISIMLLLRTVGCPCSVFIILTLLPSFKCVYYTGWPAKNVPHFRMACFMQQSRWNESEEKHVCNEQTSSNMSMNFHIKRFNISRGTSEIVLHFIKQCLQAVRHYAVGSTWLYAGYTRTSK